MADGDNSFQIQSLMGFRQALLDALPEIVAWAKEWHKEHDPIFEPYVPPVVHPTVPVSHFNADLMALGAHDYLVFA